jgi:hypothetical protein
MGTQSAVILLIYRGGDLIPVRNISKKHSLSFSRRKYTKNRSGNQIDSESRTSRLSRQGKSTKPTFMGSGMPTGLASGELA